MIVLLYPLVLALALVAIALAGIATNRNFIVIMLGIELIFVASIILLVAFLETSPTPDPSGVFMLFSIWSVAAVEVIAIIAFYVYIKFRGLSFDVSKLTRMKW